MYLLKKPLFIIALVIFLLFGTNIYTYYFSSNNAVLKSFLKDSAFDFQLLKILDENKTVEVESILTANIGILFFETARAEDITKFSLICEYINVDHFHIYDKYNNSYKSLDSKYDELYKLQESGRKKLMELCDF